MKLYKYRTWNQYAKKVITNSSLFYPKPELLNDPTELSHPIRLDKDFYNFNLERARELLDDSITSVLIETGKEIAQIEAASLLGGIENYERLEAEARYYRENPIAAINLVYKKIKPLEQALLYFMIACNEDFSLHYQSLESVIQNVNTRLASLGVMSFTSNSHSPTMWAYYANNHTGLILEFDTDYDETLATAEKINYSTERPIITAENIHDILYTKAKPWEHENEYRVYVKEGNTEYTFKSKSLSGIIMGKSIADNDKNEILEILKKNGQSLCLYQAYDALDSYKINYSEVKNSA